MNVKSQSELDIGGRETCFHKLHNIVFSLSACCGNWTNTHWLSADVYNNSLVQHAAKDYATQFANIFKEFLWQGNFEVLLTCHECCDPIYGLCPLFFPSQVLYFCALLLLSGIPVQPGPPVALLYQELY